jgi:hypothetical protein
MFGIDERRHATCTLRIRNGMKRERGFTGRFWSVDLDDAASRIPTNPERNIERE